MINNIETKIEIEEDVNDIERTQNEKEMNLNEFRTKYEYLVKQNYENYSMNEINCLNKILENTFSVEKFKSYIDKDFLDNCEYKMIFMPDEFNMKEDDKLYFQGF